MNRTTANIPREERGELGRRRVATLTARPTGTSSEPYHSVLMNRLAGLFRRRPSAPSASMRPDQLTLHQLDMAGADRTKATEIVNYLYTPTEEAARTAADELAPAGYSLEVRPAATGSQWLALATIQVPPTEQNIELIRTRFEDLAARVGGEYDGWEAAVTR